MVDFVWDEKKNQSNIRKHGISFEEARTSFFDPLHILIHDPDHSENEERMILMGVSQSSHLLVVVHAEKNENEIRIISARKAMKKERKQYEET